MELDACKWWAGTGKEAGHVTNGKQKKMKRTRLHVCSGPWSNKFQREARVASVDSLVCLSTDASVHRWPSAWDRNPFNITFSGFLKKIKVPFSWTCLVQIYSLLLFHPSWFSRRMFTGGCAASANFRESINKIESELAVWLVDNWARNWEKIKGQNGGLESDVDGRCVEFGSCRRRNERNWPAKWSSCCWHQWKR